MARRISAKTQLYLMWQRQHNKLNETWAEFYTRIYGECHWMNTNQYGGTWLGKKMGEPLDEIYEEETN
jgi:hypothetical protein